MCMLLSVHFLIVVFVNLMFVNFTVLEKLYVRYYDGIYRWLFRHQVKDGTGKLALALNCMHSSL